MPALNQPASLSPPQPDTLEGQSAETFRIGIDIGGTFTDFVVFNPADGSLHTFKVPSTPQDPSLAVLNGIDQIISQFPRAKFSINHGSTVATNALLERKGAPTALIATEGFRDILAIGRQDRPELYDLSPTMPPTIIPEHLRFEVHERVNAAGEVQTPLTFQPDPQKLPHIITNLDTFAAQLKDQGVESVAISLLFSFLHPEHEAFIAKALRDHGFFVSVSSEILPEYREFERTATTVVNAYVSPVMDRYLSRLESALPDTPLQVMQSNGGTISPARARREAVRCILSGPAGGLVAAAELPFEQPGSSQYSELQNRQAKVNSQLLTFDMGGTSTDVALIRGVPETTTEASINGLPLRVPVLDIHTIGAGGGSIAYVDPGGALRVGPQSAGATPGPACYGRTPKEQPLLSTVTDANLVLQRLRPELFLGGEVTLFPDLAHQAVASVAEQLEISVSQTALGIIEIANSHMERALRVISVARGHDPADFALVSFGGAGGLHAADLARVLGIPHVLVSPYASTFSALGMLMADVIKDYSQTIMRANQVSFDELDSLFQPLVDQANEDLIIEGITPQNTKIEKRLDLRFYGQSCELSVSFTPNWRTDFNALHMQSYGYVPEGAIEIVNLRVRGIGSVPSPRLEKHPLAGTDPAQALLGSYPVTLSSETTFDVPHYDGERLLPGNQITGPAMVVRPDTTILINRQDTACIDSYLNVWISVGSEVTT